MARTAAATQGAGKRFRYYWSRVNMGCGLISRVARCHSGRQRMSLSTGDVPYRACREESSKGHGFECDSRQRSHEKDGQVTSVTQLILPGRSSTLPFAPAVADNRACFKGDSSREQHDMRFSRDSGSLHNVRIFWTSDGSLQPCSIKAYRAPSGHQSIELAMCYEPSTFP